MADNETNFFPILDSPPFPSHISKQSLLVIFYRTSLTEFQAYVAIDSADFQARTLDRAMRRAKALAAEKFVAETIETAYRELFALRLRLKFASAMR